MLSRRTVQLSRALTENCNFGCSCHSSAAVHACLLCPSSVLLFRGRHNPSVLLFHLLFHTLLSVHIHLLREDNLLSLFHTSVVVLQVLVPSGCRFPDSSSA